MSCGTISLELMALIPLNLQVFGLNFLRNFRRFFYLAHVQVLVHRQHREQEVAHL